MSKGGASGGWGVVEVLIAVAVGAAALLGALAVLSAAETPGQILLWAPGIVVLPVAVLTIIVVGALVIELIRGGVRSRADMAGLGLEEPQRGDEDSRAWVLAALVAYLGGAVVIGYAGLVPALALALVGRRGALPRSWPRQLGNVVWLLSGVTIAAAMWSAVWSDGDAVWQRFWVW